MYMAESNIMPILSVYSTVGSRLSDLEIENGRLIFVRDKHKVALDFDGKRTFYNQIEELATEGARTSMLAPVTGLYYFVVETCVLWTYQGGWVQITTPPGQSIITDDTLILDDGVLKVNITNEIAADNTLPISSAAVHAQLGNIETLLAAI
jgi:hypothetical protein